MCILGQPGKPPLDILETLIPSRVRPCHVLCHTIDQGFQRLGEFELCRQGAGDPAEQPVMLGQGARTEQVGRPMLATRNTAALTSICISMA
jgi:hypothetical protein